MSKECHLYFKSLAGHIIPICLSELDSLPNLQKKWEKIRYIIANHMECSESQIVVLEENDVDDVDQKHIDQKHLKDDEDFEDFEEIEKILNIPPIIPESNYNFIVREKDHYNHIYVSVYYDYRDNDDKILHIEIYKTYKPEDKQIIKFDLENESHMFYILLKELTNFSWYDKIQIADRIMRQWENIIKNSNDEYYDEYEYAYNENYEL